MKVIIAGGRDYRFTMADAKWLEDFHNDYKITKVVSGRASGADREGEKWAEGHNIPVEPFPADWYDLEAEGAVIRTNKWGVEYNANAGFARNEIMAEYADAAIIFPGGNGSRDMAQRMHEKGKLVYDFNKPK